MLANNSEEILGIPPRWILKSGFLILIFLFLLITTLLFTINLPLKVDARTLIIPNNYPISIQAKSKGKVTLFLEKNKVVEKGSILGYIQSNTSYQAYSHLCTLLRSHQFKNNDYDFIYNKLVSFSISDYGYFTPVCKSLINILIRLKVEHLQRENKVDIASLSDKIAGLNEIKQNLSLQIAYNAEELEIGILQYERDSILLDNKSIASVDFERSRKSLLELKKSLNNSKLQKRLTDNEITKFRNDIKLLNQEYLVQSLSNSSMYLVEVASLRSAIAEWENNYLLRSPESGYIEILDLEKKNQFIEASQTIGRLISRIGPTNKIATFYLPYSLATKIKKNDLCKLTLDGYPELEYGHIECSISRATTIPNENLFRFEIDIPPSKFYEFKKSVVVKEEMQGSIQIVYSNNNLYKTILNKIYKIFDKNKGG